MLARLALVATFLVAACGGTPESPNGAEDPVRAEAVSGRFGLAFTLPQAVWTTSEEIRGEAALMLAGGGSVALGASGGGPIAFSIAEVGGTRAMMAASDSSCETYELSAAAPIGSPIRKSGGWGADDPNAAFYRAFFNDPLLHLPAGVWDISAVATFIEGAGCQGQSHELTATIRISVAD